jgi:GNAT superfamily N-acetyltransferase
MRIFNPATDLDALTALVALCHPQRLPRAALWWQIFPTIVVDGDGAQGLIGYTQFSVGETTLYLYDTGVHPDVRRSGMGRRFMAERLALGQRIGCDRAIGYAEVTNTPMRMLLAQAKFSPGEMWSGYYKEFTPARDAIRYMSTPASFEWAVENAMVAEEARA